MHYFDQRILEIFKILSGGIGTNDFAMSRATGLEEIQTNATNVIMHCFEQAFRKHLKAHSAAHSAAHCSGGTNAGNVILHYFEQLVSESSWKRTGEEVKTNATM